MALGPAVGAPELKGLHPQVLRRRLHPVIRNRFIYFVEHRHQSRHQFVAAPHRHCLVFKQAQKQVAGLVHGQIGLQPQLVQAGCQPKGPALQLHLGREVVGLAADAPGNLQLRRLLRLYLERDNRQRPFLHRQHLGGRKFQLYPGPVGRQIRQHQFTRGGNPGALGKVLGVLQEEAGEVVAGFEQLLLEEAHVLGLGEIRDSQAVPPAQGRGHAHGLGTVGAGGHHAAGGEGHVGGADDAAGQKQVGDVAAVEAAEGDVVDSLAVPLVAAGLFAEHPVSRVQVQRPAAEGHGIRVLPLLHHVLLAQHVVALKPAALPLTGNVAHPLQRQVLRLRKPARVLDIIPHPVHHLPQLPLDLLGLVHRVEPAAVLDPPQAAAVVAGVEGLVPRNLGDVLQGVGRGHETHGLAGVFAVEVDGVAEQFAVLIRRSEFLLKLLPGLRPHPKSGSRQEAQDAVAGGVAEEGGVQFVAGGVLAAEGGHAFYLISPGFAHLVNGRVEQQRDIRLRHHLLQDHGVEDDGVALGVTVRVLDQNLVDHAAFAGPAVVVAHVGGGAQNPQPHLARGVAAQHRPVLHQHHPATRPGRRDGAAAAGQPSPHHHQVRLQHICLGVSFFRYVFFDHVFDAVCY